MEENQEDGNRIVTLCLTKEEQGFLLQVTEVLGFKHDIDHPAIIKLQDDGKRVMQYVHRQLAKPRVVK